MTLITQTVITEDTIELEEPKYIKCDAVFHSVQLHSTHLIEPDILVAVWVPGSPL